LENIFAWLESLTGKNCFKKLVIRTETGLQLKKWWLHGAQLTSTQIVIWLMFSTKLL